MDFLQVLLIFDSAELRRNEHKIPDELFAKEFFLGFCDVFEEEGLGK